MDSLDEIVLETLANICNVERSALAPDTTLTDIGFDSLGASAFASEMDASHGVPIEPEDLGRLYMALTPAEVITLMKELRARNAVAAGG